MDKAMGTQKLLQAAFWPDLRWRAQLRLAGHRYRFPSGRFATIGIPVPVQALQRASSRKSRTEVEVRSSLDSRARNRLAILLKRSRPAAASGPESTALYPRHEALPCGSGLQSDARL